MKPLKEMTKEELLAMKETLSAEYKEAQAKGLKLDMSRGKPEKWKLFRLNMICRIYFMECVISLDQN